MSTFNKLSPRTYKRSFGPKLRTYRAARGLKPLDRATMASCNLPIILDNNEQVPSIARITVVACDGTEAIMGFLVSTNPTSTETLEMCLENAIAPKQNPSGGVRTEHAYEMCGMPKTIVVDRGVVESAFAEMNEPLGRFHVETARPMFCGPTERFFRRLGQDLPIYLKACGWKPVKEGSYYRCHKDRSMTLADLNAAVLRYLVDYYHQIPRGENKSIAQAWKEGLEARTCALSASKAA